MERDKFMSADEAKAFGLVDEVFDRRPVPGEEGGLSAVA
ncbi:ATP-dependent Clp protease proteolytic subunit [Salmonella enterica]